jgi:hypothetical protein
MIGLLLTQRLLYAIPSSESMRNRRGVDSKFFRPAGDRLSFSAKTQMSREFLRLLAKRILLCPSSREPVVNSVYGYTSLFRPFSDRHCATVKLKFSPLACRFQEFSIAPSFSYPDRKSCGAYAYFPGPFAKAFCFGSDFNPYVSSSVGCLNICGFPAAIRWFVISIYVYAFNAVFVRWFLPHVAQERIKGISPFVTYDYASFAVTVVSRIVRVVASRNHGTPSSVLGAFGPSVRCVSQNGFFSSSTAAVSRLIVSQIRGANNFEGSACAFAKPRSLSGVGGKARVLLDGPFPVLMSRQVIHISRNCNRIVFSHLKVPRILDVVRTARRLLPAGLFAFYSKFFAIGITSIAKGGK